MGQKPIWIEPDAKKEKYRVTVPNVRSWAVGGTESLADLVRVDDLPQIHLNPKETPPNVHVRPVVGGASEAIMTLEKVRKEWPVLRTAFLMAEELYQETNPGAAAELGIGPTFDELLDVSQRYLTSRVIPLEVGGVKSAAYHYQSIARGFRVSVRWTASRHPTIKRSRSAASRRGSNLAPRAHAAEMAAKSGNIPSVSPAR